VVETIASRLGTAIEQAATSKAAATTAGAG